MRSTVYCCSPASPEKQITKLVSPQVELSLQVELNLEVQLKVEVKLQVEVEVERQVQAQVPTARSASQMRSCRFANGRPDAKC